MRRARGLGMVRGTWWALLRGPASLPVLFGSKREAQENRDEDEYLVEVYVSPNSVIQLLRGRKEMLRRQKAAGSQKGAKRGKRKSVR